MVFIGGPRQVGKTTLAQTIAEEHFLIPFIYQLVEDPGVDFLQDQIRVMSVEKFLTRLV